MFLSERMPSESTASPLFRRKGGGGGGHGSGKGGGKSGSGGKGGGRATDVAKKHGAPAAFLDSRSAKSFGIPSTKISALSYADGGGKSVTLGSDSPFSGRLAGGGSRASVYGTSRFGSGYPYGGYGTFVDSRPFPYYFIPVPVSYNYYGGNEYLNVNNTKRPGGNLVTAIVQPLNSSSIVTYRLVGDNSSVTAVFDAVVANCSVANTSAIAAFAPSLTTWPLPEQIVQYYRASSFALSLDSYNNTATLLANSPTSNSSSLPQLQDTPLPSGLNMTFLECLNSTVGSSVPLVDFQKKRLSEGAIVGITFASVFGFFVIAVCCGMYCSCNKGRKGKY